MSKLFSYNNLLFQVIFKEFFNKWLLWRRFKQPLVSHFKQLVMYRF